jgi:hypothetical protein
MNTVAARLIAFTLLLAGSFGSAYAAGERWPGHRHDGQNDRNDDGQNGGHEHGSAPPDAAGAMHGYQLVRRAGTDPLRPSFVVRDPDGDTVTRFDTVHERPLHALVVRPDLSGFQHLHPTIGSDGAFSVELPAPGTWHVVFDFTPTRGPELVLAANIDDETPVEAAPLPPESDTAEAAGITVRRDGLGFTPSIPTTEIEPYLGQPAHLVAFRQGDLAYVHLHPSDMQMGETLMFDDTLDAGTWRLFLQLQVDGDVHTFEFTAVVT